MLKTTATAIPDVLIIEPRVFRDERGFFFESYHADKYREAGINATFVQDNHSRSQRGILRGLHLQYRHPQAKLVRVLRGEIFDVVVDARRGSPTYKTRIAVTLSSDSFQQLYVPVGCLHGFCVTSDEAEVEYKCSDVYDPTSELTVLWNDPALGIVWPTTKPILSAKDQAGLTFAAAEPRLLAWREPS